VEDLEKPICKNTREMEPFSSRHPEWGSGGRGFKSRRPDFDGKSLKRRES
jgi:hypothetical protein